MRKILKNLIKRPFAGRQITQSVTHPREKIKLRKNYLPLIITILVFWMLILGEIYFVDPRTPYAVPLFFLLLFSALFFTGATIFANSRRGFLSAVALTSFSLLRYFGVGTFLNFILIFALAITIEIYVMRH